MLCVVFFFLFHFLPVFTVLGLNLEGRKLILRVGDAFLEKKDISLHLLVSVWCRLAVGSN